MTRQRILILNPVASLAFVGRARASHAPALGNLGRHTTTLPESGPEG